MALLLPFCTCAVAVDLSSSDFSVFLRWAPGCGGCAL